MELRDKIGSRGVRCPDVHAIVVFWGEFAQRVHEENGSLFAYVSTHEKFWRQLPPRVLKRVTVS